MVICNTRKFLQNFVPERGDVKKVPGTLVLSNYPAHSRRVDKPVTEKLTSEQHKNLCVSHDKENTSRLI